MYSICIGWYNAVVIDTAPTQRINMPIYCWRTEDGEAFENYFPMAEVPEFLFTSDGRKALRDYAAERVSGNVKERSERSRGWPMAPCVGSGVNAEQAPELREHFRKHNVDCEVTTDGDPIYTSASQRKKALKCRGMHDKSSFN